MQGVNGPNAHKKNQKSGSNGSQGLDSADMGLKDNRFKASSSDNFGLESDQEHPKKAQEAAEMLNKQSFSANPRDLKKSSSN